ncbi:MAG: HAD-IC family P-type ATPase, partial [Solirubrobacterales bacterium]|nr:HAD-IC family P-type ATPase [Solirubrobacterales bacterium]
KILSGDSSRTAAAIAGDVGVPVKQAVDGSAIPEDPEARRRFAAETTVVGRISPDGKQAMIQALSEQGRYVAMIGDGVNDVPALKSARLGIAQGSGAQMARSVADVVLVNGDFASIPALISEGRQSLRNLQRVSKLYFTKSSFAAFLIVTVGLSSDAYPLLPRHLTLASSLTIGIPSFLLALAPSTGPWRTEGFGRKVARFAVPAGVLIGTGVLSGYLFSLHDLDLSVPRSRMVALTTLVATGLYLVMALEAGGSSRRSRLVGRGCALMALLYVLAIAIPFTRDFFSLTILNLSMLATALLASVFSAAGLWASGFTLGLAAHDPDSAPPPEPHDSAPPEAPKRAGITRAPAGPSDPALSSYPRRARTP